MKEIIVAGVGSCGINLTGSYLSLMNDEHDLQKGKNFDFNNELVVHFNESKSQTPISRFLFIDLDPITIDQIYCHPYVNQLNPDNLLSGDSSSMNLYSNGFYEKSHCVIDKIMDSFQREIEKCDSLQAILFNHSTSGGTGSGLGILLMEKLKEVLGDYKIIANTIVPSIFEENSQSFDVSALSIYNSILTIPKMIEHDNNALSKYYPPDYSSNKNLWGNPNKIASKTISALTSGSRFSGLNQLNIRKIITNIVPSWCFTFFSSFYFEDFGSKPDFVNNTFQEIMRNKNSLFTINEDYQTKVVTSASFFRGKGHFSSELEELNTKEFHGKLFWVQHLVGHIDKCSNQKVSQEVVHISQGAHLGHYIKKLREAFHSFYKRKAFVHWYYRTGLDTIEFIDADEKLENLEFKYLYTEAGIQPNYATEE